MKAEAGSVAGGHGHVRLRKTLVGVQVGLATVLLIGAGLFVRTLQELRTVNLGLRTENVIIMGVRPAVMYDEARKRQVFRSLIESLATVPGVKAVGANSTRLFMGGRWDSQITIPGVGPRERPPSLVVFQRRHARILRRRSGSRSRPAATSPGTTGARRRSARSSTRSWSRTT